MLLLVQCRLYSNIDYSNSRYTTRSKLNSTSIWGIFEYEFHNTTCDSCIKEVNYGCMVSLHHRLWESFEKSKTKNQKTEKRKHDNRKSVEGDRRIKRNEKQRFEKKSDPLQSAPPRATSLGLQAPERGVVDGQQARQEAEGQEETEHPQHALALEGPLPVQPVAAHAVEHEGHQHRREGDDER